MKLLPSNVRQWVAKTFAADFIRGRDADDSAPALPGTSRLSQPYAQSAWVRAAVNHVAGEIAGQELKFYAGETEFEDAAFAAFWAAPAYGPRTLTGTQPRLSLGDVLRDLAAWAKLEGEFFLLFDDSWGLPGLRPAGAVSPFLIARPDRMQIILSYGEILGWRYSQPNGRLLTLLPEQVEHWKGFNPYDDWRGVGDLRAALVAAEGAFLTGTYIRELMRNNGDQGFIVIGKSGVIDDAQREQIVADLRAKRNALRRGIARDIFLTGDISVDRPAERAASTDLNVGKSLSHQEIFVAFGVPPSMAEVKASYSTGKDSDYYQLITRTCQPLGQSIAEVLGRLAARMTGKALCAELEWDDHPVMVEVRNSRIDALQKLWGMGMPVANANDFLDLGMKPFPGWDVGYLPFSVTPTASDSQLSPFNSQPAGSDPASDPAMSEPAAVVPEIENLRLLMLARQRAARPAPVARRVESGGDFSAFACNHGAEAIAQRAERNPAEIAEWRTHMAKRRETVKSFQSGIGRVLRDARIETLRRLDAKKSASGPSTFTPQLSTAAPSQKAGSALDFVFDLAKFAEAFTGVMRNQHKVALNTAGKQLFAEVGRDDPFAFPPAEVLNFLAGRQNKLSSIPGSIHEEIKAAIEEGLVKGESTDQIAARVRAAFNGIDADRAKRIALTETAAAYGAGRDEAMKQAGVTYKAWLTSGNANVRSAHLEAGLTYPKDGGIPYDEPFVVDGELLMYPGDDAGSPGNVINCHCISIAVAAPDA